MPRETVTMDELQALMTSNTLEHHWCPFTSNRDFKAHPRLMARGEGVYYWNEQGEKIIDGSSGLFCCPLGHGRREIADAVHAQLTTMDFAPHFQAGHRLSFELASRLARILPDGMDRIFFGCSGSEAVDTAIKIALAYHRANGEAQRTRFVSRERAYHGVNIAGTALSGIVKNRRVFDPVTFPVAHLRHTWLEANRFAPGQPTSGAELADDLERICQLYGGDTIAACFVEPIAGSTGTLVPPVGYLERLREICDRHGILLVFDEVITGFGRTGRAFAAQSFGVRPDVITMAKAITNAAQPLSAVAVDERLYDTVVDAAPAEAIEFFHGYTYSGHPAACAAGIVVQEIYEREDVFARAAAMAPYFQERLFALADIPVVTDVRGYGMMGGIDLAADGPVGHRGLETTKRFWDAGLHVKFTGDAGILAPPLVAERAHVDEVFDKAERVLRSC
jgi:beta-alanine--pyruvate transaminase